MTLTITHDYTPDTVAAVVTAWRRVLDAPGVEVVQQTPWGVSRTDGFGRPIEITDEWLTALVISDGGPTDRFPAVTAVLISYSDYGGSDLDAANVRTLSGWAGISVLTDGCHGASSAEMTVGELPADDYPCTDIADAIARVGAVADVLERLADYPLLCDEDHAVYVDELATAAWDQWVRADLRSEVIDRLDALRCTGNSGSGQVDSGPHHHSGADHCEADGWDRWDAADESAIREAYYEASVDGWECESATSVVNRHHDAAVIAVLRAVFGVDPAD